jgi:hypothetical protein
LEELGAGFREYEIAVGARSVKTDIADIGLEMSDLSDDLLTFSTLPD